MKRTNLLVLICIITVFFIIFTQAICEDNDFAYDMSCDINGLLYYGLFAGILLCVGVLFECDGTAVYSASPIMTYLERHEKSPPL